MPDKPHAAPAFSARRNNPQQQPARAGLRLTENWARDWARVGAATLVAVAVATLMGCASSPPRPASPAPGAPVRSAPAPTAGTDAGRDGPGEQIPPDLHKVPDAQPRLEPVRLGGPNKPYEVLGQTYAPLAGDPPLVQRGLASWYGRKFHGRGTANGETYNMYAMTAAHKTMPLPSYARVRNPANGREVVVRVNDRGPFHSDRVIDLSYTAALRLGLLGGVAPVEIERITYEAIRTGAWRAPALPGGDDGVAGATVATAVLLPETAGWLADDAIAEIGRRSADWPSAALLPVWLWRLTLQRPLRPGWQRCAKPTRVSWPRAWPRRCRPDCRQKPRPRRAPPTRPPEASGYSSAPLGSARARSAFSNGWRVRPTGWRRCWQSLTNASCTDCRLGLLPAGPMPPALPTGCALRSAWCPPSSSGAEARPASPSPGQANTCCTAKK